MRFFIITDYSFDIKERIPSAIFSVDFLFKIDKNKVRKYLEKYSEAFVKRALRKFDIDKTLKFIKEKVSDAFAHDYTSNIIDVTELSYRIICVDCQETETLFYKNDLKTYGYLVYFKSDCNYNIIGNPELITGVALSAFTKNGVTIWSDKNSYEKFIDCIEDIEVLIDNLYFNNARGYLKLSSDENQGEFFLLENYTDCY